jgi:hypothetical protein
MKSRHTRLPLVLTVLSVPTFAAATTIDFSSIGGPGDLNMSSYIDPGTNLAVQGFYFNELTEMWVMGGANLYVRDEENDHGIGICSPLDRGQGDADSDDECPGPEGGGNWNELDNEDLREIIRLELPAGYEWVSVQLSSLDTNGNLNLPEFGRLYANNTLDGDPGTIESILWSFQGGVEPVEPVFFIPASASLSRFLFFEPIDWDDPPSNPDNNDFLVYQATIDRRDAVEPGTLGLLGIGIVALGRARRRR